MHLLYAAGTVSLYAASITGLAFVVYYHLTATWWKSEAGWHLMSWTFATEVMFAYLSFASLVRKPGAPLPATNLLWIRFVVYTVFFGLIAWRLSFVARAQRRRFVARNVPPSQVPPIPL